MEGPYSLALIAEWRKLLGSAEYVVLSADPFRIPWSNDMSYYFNQNFGRVVKTHGVTVYRYIGPPR